MPGLSVARHRLAPFLLQAPSVTALLLWSIVPLVMTLWFSFRRYNLLEPSQTGFAHLENYRYLLGDPSLGPAILNTFLLVGWVLVITVGLGTLLAILYDQDFFGRSVTRVMVVAPFFVMPTVSALIWKDMSAGSKRTGLWPSSCAAWGLNQSTGLALPR